MKRFRLFVRGVSTNWVGTLGVALTTATFLLFVGFQLLQLAGILTNAYVGLVSYLALPALFVLGLILIPCGWWRFRRAAGKTTAELLDERFPAEMVAPRRLGSSLLATVALLTVVNILFLGVGGARMLHFMDTPRFCGTACHGVMEPEWTAYRNSPHAHVACVDCHVGEGAKALLDAKLNGLWQIVSLTFDLFERPIPTPVHQLRPARETCETCHWPAKFYGDRIKTFPHFALDEASTPSYTTLSLKVGSGEDTAAGTIHWHVADRNEVRYLAADEGRQVMQWVEVRRGNAYHRYTNTAFDPATVSRPVSEKHAGPRSMDCVDCHNRATHIYEWPDDALDKRITLGLLDRSLPFIKQQGMKAITNEYPDSAAAMAGIANEINSFYQREHPDIALSRSAGIDSAVAVLHEVYNRNIHHGMNITWGTYASKIGHHDDEGGCFRCHDGSMVAEDGSRIDDDCTLCHSIIAYESDAPYEFVLEPDTSDINYEMHRYLRAEFLRSVQLAVQDMPTMHE